MIRAYILATALSSEGVGYRIKVIFVEGSRSESCERALLNFEIVVA